MKIISTNTTSINFRPGLSCYVLLKHIWKVLHWQRTKAGDYSVTCTFTVRFNHILGSLNQQCASFIHLWRGRRIINKSFSLYIFLRNSCRSLNSILIHISLPKSIAHAIFCNLEIRYGSVISNEQCDGIIGSNSMWVSDKSWLTLEAREKLNSSSIK